MTFNFTEEQIMIRDMVREFTKKEVEPRDKWMDENGFDYELHKKLTQAGLMGIHLDEKYGGGGGDAVTSIIVIHEIAKGSASEALFLDANWLAADLILYHGTEAQKDKYLPQAAQGKIFAFGLTESCAGSDAAGIKSTVVPADDGGWILNGGKAWITNSGVADYYIILAKTDPAAGNKGISAFIVPKDAEGLTIGKFEDKMGMRGSATCELSFDNIHLPADALLGSLGMGFKMAMQALDGARISIGAIAAGLAEHAMTIAKNYANERTAFGKPIGKYRGHPVQVRGHVRRDPRHGAHDLRHRPHEGRGQAPHPRGRADQALLRRPLHADLPRVPAGPRRQRLQQGVPRGALRPRRQAA